MLNPLLFIECPNRLLLLQRMWRVLTRRVVSFGDLHFQKGILVLKGSTLYSLYKEGGQAGRRVDKEGVGEGVYKASAPHFRIYSFALGPLASLAPRVRRVLGSTVGSILEKETICNLGTTLL